MVSGILYTVFIALVVGPALFGIKHLKELREGGTSLDKQEKLKLSGLFGPMVIFLFVYLIAMFIVLSRQG